MNLKTHLKLVIATHLYDFRSLELKIGDFLINILFSYLLIISSISFILDTIFNIYGILAIFFSFLCFYFVSSAFVNICFNLKGYQISFQKAMFFTSTVNTYNFFKYLTLSIKVLFAFVLYPFNFIYFVSLTEERKIKYLVSKINKLKSLCDEDLYCLDRELELARKVVKSEDVENTKILNTVLHQYNKFFNCKTSEINSLTSAIKTLDFYLSFIAAAKYNQFSFLPLELCRAVYSSENKAVYEEQMVKRLEILKVTISEDFDKKVKFYSKFN